VDPALWELLRAEEDTGEDRVIEAIIRLARPGIEIPDVRMVARFGTIATCRLLASDVVAVHDRDDVASLKAARSLGEAWEPDSPDLSELPTALGHRPTDVRRPPGLDVTGRGVVVGSVDWGLDVASAALRTPADGGGSRFLALWDQRDVALGPRPQPYGYGAVHDRAAIDRALRRGRPYDDLGYHPAVADSGNGSHGMHVLDIAAGNGRAGGPVGIAPDADLVAVHLADRGTGGLATLGDSVRLLEAVHFIASTAGKQPWVINLSLGRTGGSHDGCSLTELALDELLGATPGGFVVQSAGNYYRSRTHAAGRLSPGDVRTLRFETRPGDVTPNELEIWYDGADEYAVRIDPPGAVAARPVLLGERAELVDGGRVVGRVFHRCEPNSLANHVDVFLEPLPRGGEWTVTLEARRVVDGRFHAWIERDDSCPQCQARFRPGDSRTESTTGTIANGRLPLVVGAYGGHDLHRAPAPFSSVGPTRDGRDKPDLSAPGMAVLAARSTPLGAPPDSGLLVRKSGTSMATPHVTGAVALCLELGGHALDAPTIRRLVLGSCEPVPATDPPLRLGVGRLDIARLVAAARLHQQRHPEEHPMDADATSILQTPDTLYRECLYRPDGDAARTLQEQFEVVGRPGDRVAGQPGDVLVEVRLGRPGGRAVVPDHPSDLGAGPLPHGRLLLRPREVREDCGTESGWQEDTPSKLPAHVAVARALWTRLFGKDRLLGKVTVLDYANVPSDAVREQGYDAWTNSVTTIYVAPSAVESTPKLETTLRHEAVHIRQFGKDRRPRSYEQMARYERDAYRENVVWLKQQVSALQRVAKPTQAQLDDLDAYKELCAMAEAALKVFEDALTNGGAVAKAEREAWYRHYLISNCYLPYHRQMDDLYAPAKEWRNPAAAEESDEQLDDAVTEFAGDSFADDLLGELLALEPAGDEADDEPLFAEFSGPEHKDLGDLASGTEATSIPFGNPPRPLTFGDVISLAGDYYETYEQMRDLGTTPEGRAELEYARWKALDLDTKGVARPPVGKPVVERVSERALLLDSRNLSHFSAHQMAWQAYSLWHGKAIADALEAGRTPNDAIWRRALTKDAFGGHFLTDSFSAGHVRTPRGDIRDWYLQRFPDSSEKFVAYMARFLFNRLDERQQLPALLWWVGWVTRSMMGDSIRKLGGAAVSALTLGDLVGLALHDLDNEGLDVVSDVDADGHAVSGGYHWRAVGDSHLHSSPMGATTKAMAIAAVIASLRDLERVRGLGVRIGSASVTPPAAAAQIQQALGEDGFAARRFVPREDTTSTANLRLPRPAGGMSRLEWRWGQLGDAAYGAVDTAVRKRIPPELHEMADGMDKWIDTPVGRVYGTPDAVRAFARHLRETGIAALEAAVGASAVGRP
jgi:subtilisin family serine protease